MNTRFLIKPLAMKCVLLAAIAATFCACAEHGSPTPPDPRTIATYRVTELPDDVVLVGARLGEVATYVGYALETTSIIPGDETIIHHYWQVHQTPPSGTRVFAWLDGTAASEYLPLDDTPMRRIYPPTAWQPGDLLEDSQTFVVPPSWRTASVALHLGLTAGRAVADRQLVLFGPSADRAALIATLPIDLANAPPPPPPPGTVIVRRAVGPITVDGIANEATWTQSLSSPPFVTAQDGSPEPVGSAVAKLSWDDKALYVFASVTDTDVSSQYTDDDAPLWKEDVIEIFIDADGNRRGYVELQVNPHNAHFDSWFAKTRSQPGDVSFTSGMRSAVRVRGTLSDHTDKDAGWDVEIAIPWEAVKGRDEQMAVTLPPPLGSSFQLNVVRVDKPEGKSVSASSWNQISYQDFHGLDRMLTVVFADSQGRTKAEKASPVSGDEPVIPDDESVVPGDELVIPGDEPALDLSVSPPPTSRRRSPGSAATPGKSSSPPP